MNLCYILDNLHTYYQISNIFFLLKGMLNKQAVYEGSQKAVEDEENAKIQAADKRVGSCAICFEAPRTHIFIA